MLVLVAFVICAPLALRTRFPLGAWAFSAAALIWSSLVIPPGSLGGSDVPVAGVLVYALCLYAVTVRCRPRIVVAAAATTLAGASFIDPATLPQAVFLTVVPILLGVLVRVRRSGQRQLAEQERRHSGERALLEERQRIARELHDVVAHHMSVIAIQAEAAPYKTADPPAELVESFGEIRASALAGLSELRRVLGVLRTGGRDTVPQPGLAELDALLDSARNGGVSVTVSRDGDPVTLPEGVDLSAYRIVQEALSNAMRHAPGSQVRLNLAYRPGTLVIEIGNDAAPVLVASGERAAGHLAGGGGHGLVGMRERATMLGGSLEAGPAGDGGFRVTAVLPLSSPGGGAVTIRVIVADDQGMVRSGFSILLNAQPDIEVVGEAVNGQEAIDRAAELSPDVILMDVRMPVMDGLQATRQIAAADDAPRVLMLTTFDLDDYVYEALRAGASGFLLKDASAGELAEAVRVVAAGDALLAPGVTRRLIAEFARLGAPRAASRKNLEGPDRARDRGAGAGGPRHVQHGDRRSPGGGGADGQDARQPGADEAGVAGPGAGGGVRLRERPRPGRGVTRVSRRSPDVAFAAAACVVLVGYNNFVGRRPWHRRWYPVVNGCAAAAALAAAAASGLRAGELGLGRDRLRAGVRCGSAAALPVVAAYGVAVLTPAIRPLLDDQRVAGLDRRQLAYQVLVRIPVGTVVWEEVAFRGVLQAALRRVLDEPWASAVGASVFGLWHIRPTVGALAVNGLAKGRGARMLAVTGVVAGMAGAGVVLSVLRERSGSLVAPVLVHLAANCTGPVASALARRLRNRSRHSRPASTAPAGRRRSSRAVTGGRPRGWRPAVTGAVKAVTGGAASRGGTPAGYLPSLP